MHFFAIISFLFGAPGFATPTSIQYPELLIPLKKPNQIMQSLLKRMSQSATTDEQWAAVSFYVPDNVNICRLRFLINTNPIKNSPFDLKGESHFIIDVSRVEPKLVNGRSTWNNKPIIIERYDTFVLSMTGVSETLNKWFPCPKRSVAQFVVHPANMRDLEVCWFELNYNPEDGGPHGLVLEMYT